MHPLSWRARLLLPAVLVCASALVFLVRLGQPDQIVFDETYYVNDARAYLDQGVEDSFAVHPPVGKWLIGSGIAVFGDEPFGWRVAGAAAGTLTVALVYALGLRLFRRVAPAALATLLVATDGLIVVHARTSMLDIFLALFVVLGALLLVVDHDRNRLTGPLPLYAVPSGASTERDPPTSAPIVGPQDADDARLPPRHGAWRYAAGVAFGLAIATKWSGLLALGAAGLLAIGWELAWRWRWTGRWWVTWRQGLAAVAVPLVAVPAAVYLASWVPWVVNFAATSQGQQACPEGGCDVGLADRLGGLADHHADIWRFHTGLEAEHPYRAPPTTWPVLTRPVVYHWESCPPDRTRQVPRTDPDTGEVTRPQPCVVAAGEAEEVLAIGNPALWWGFLAAAPLVVAGMGRRDPRAYVVVAFWAGQFLPWLVVSRPAFLFYMVPVVPFLALGVAYAVVTVLERALVLPPLLAAAAGGAVGWLAGLAVEVAGVPRARWLGLGVAAAAASVAAAWWWRRSEHAPPQPGARAGGWLGIATAVAAVAAFVYFLPVWTAVELPEEMIRARWWLTSWV